MVRALSATGGLLLVLALGGCTYDYMQRTDRVGYSAGDAVRANLERETMNPTKRSMYDTRGLGKDGKVVPSDGSGAPITPVNPPS